LRINRIRLESALAIASGTLCVLTFVWRDWIEAVFRVDPDRHSGALEWAIVAVLVAAFATFTVRVQVLRRARVNSR
jgi:hypothetical protein